MCGIPKWTGPAIVILISGVNLPADEYTNNLATVGTLAIAFNFEGVPRPEYLYFFNLTEGGIG